MRKRKLTQEIVIRALIKARGEAGITQQVLAGRLGKPQSFVSKFETGERQLNFIEVIEVMEALGVDPVEEFERLYSGT